MVPELSDSASRRLYAETYKYAAALLRYAQLKRGGGSTVDAARRYAEVLALVEFFAATTHTHRRLLEAMVGALVPLKTPRPEAVKVIADSVSK